MTIVNCLMQTLAAIGTLWSEAILLYPKWDAPQPFKITMCLNRSFGCALQYHAAYDWYGVLSPALQGGSMHMLGISCIRQPSLCLLP